MDSTNLKQALAALSIPTNHTSIGLTNLLSTSSNYQTLFLNHRLPPTGFTDTQIHLLLYQLSVLDTNNSPRRCGVGEREARIYSSMVSNRHFGMGHGVGRSGDLCEPQPKAVGSSAIAVLTKYLVLDVLRRGCGMEKRSSARFGMVLPLCTGMSMALTLQSFKTDTDRNRNIVLWCRIDQKSCFKAIQTAGCIPIIIPTLVVDDCVTTSLVALREQLTLHGDRVLAVITTTSCFAPRIPDKVDEVAKLLDMDEEFGGVHHVINNAYGLQCPKTVKLINRACAVGKVCAIVCSTDKNFMVPVGGAIITSPSETIIQNIGKLYPGRANASPVLDLFITLLSMGLNGYQELVSERMRLVNMFQTKLTTLAIQYNERVLVTYPWNSISFGMTLHTLSDNDLSNKPNVNVDGDPNPPTDTLPIPSANTKTKAQDEISYFGSMLFTRCVSGTRVVPTNIHKTIAAGNVQYEFEGFGSSTDEYPHPYVTMACAIGLSESELDDFFGRMEKCLKDFFVKKKKRLHKKEMERRKKEEKEALDKVNAIEKDVESLQI